MGNSGLEGIVLLEQFAQPHYVLREGTAYFVSCERASDLSQFETGALPDGDPREPGECFRGARKGNALLVDPRVSEGFLYDLKDLLGTTVSDGARKLRIERPAADDLEAHERIRRAPLHTVSDGALVELAPAANLPSAFGSMLHVMHTYLERGRTDPLDEARATLSLFSALPRVSRLLSELEEQKLFDASGFDWLKRFFIPHPGSEGFRYHVTSALPSRGGKSGLYEFLDRNRRSYEFFLENLDDLVRGTSLVPALRDVGICASAYARSGQHALLAHAREGLHEITRSLEEESVLATSPAGRHLSKREVPSGLATPSLDEGGWHGYLAGAERLAELFSNPLLKERLRESSGLSAASINDAEETVRSATSLLDAVDTPVLREDLLALPYPSGGRRDREIAIKELAGRLGQENPRIAIAHAYLSSLAHIDLFTEEGNLSRKAGEALAKLAEGDRESVLDALKAYPRGLTQERVPSLAQSYQGRRLELQRLVHAVQRLGHPLPTLQDRLDEHKETIERMERSARELGTGALSLMYTHALILDQHAYGGAHADRIEQGRSAVANALAEGSEEGLATALSSEREFLSTYLTGLERQWLPSQRWNALCSEAVSYWKGKLEKLEPKGILDLDAADAPDLGKQHAKDCEAYGRNKELLLAPAQHVRWMAELIIKEVASPDGPMRMEAYARHKLAEAGLDLKRQVL